MGLLSDLERLINEHASASVLRDHVLLLKDQMTQLEKEKEKLKTNLQQSQEDCAKLRAQLKNQSVADQFIEHDGFLFKRKTNGGYSSTVFCPDCKQPMWSTEDFFPFECTRCSIVTPWNKHDLPRILEELPK